MAFGKGFRYAKGSAFLRNMEWKVEFKSKAFQLLAVSFTWIGWLKISKYLYYQSFSRDFEVHSPSYDR
jgi:hypothetical protein